MIESDVERSFFLERFFIFNFSFRLNFSRKPSNWNIHRHQHWPSVWLTINLNWVAVSSDPLRKCFVPAHGRKTFQFWLIFPRGEAQSSVDRLSAGKLLLIDGHIVERLAMLFTLLNHQHMLDSLDCESFDFLKEIRIWLNELLEIFFAESGMESEARLAGSRRWLRN